MARKTAASPADLISIRVTIRDTARRRRIAAHLLVSRSARNAPIILFSHGTNVPPESYFYLARHWAEHGYACILPRHHGLSERIDSPRFWALRPRDLLACRDALARIERRHPELRGKVDPTRIGIAGHSHGAYATLLLAGARTRERIARVPDGSARAYLAISPPGAGCLGITTGSYRSLRGPLMTVSGTRDSDRTFSKPPPWRLDPFRGSPAARVRYNATIRDADHYSFIDAWGLLDGALAAPDTQTQASVRELTLLFWEAHLRGRPRALARLRSRAARSSARSATSGGKEALLAK